MRAVVQRVKEASVKVNGKIISEISTGLMVLIAISENDNDETIKWMANKLINLRIFSDDNGKMNKSVIDKNGEMLVVSNFTLYGDAKKGFRPSFVKSAPPEISEPLFKRFVDFLKSNYSIKIESGIFAAMMDVSLINDGPVTIIIDKE